MTARIKSECDCPIRDRAVIDCTYNIKSLFGIADSATAALPVDRGCDNSKSAPLVAAIKRL